MAVRRLLGLLLLASLCAATVQPFSHDLFELYPINEGMIAVFGGGIRLGALVDINDATHIFTEGELLAPDTATPWSMSKVGSNRVVSDALGTKQAEITEDITFLQKLWGAHAIFHLKDTFGSEIATVEKETQGDRTILHFKRAKQVLANLVIEGQGANHGVPARAQLAILSSDLKTDHRILLLLCGRNIISYNKNRKTINWSNTKTWAEVISTAKNYFKE